MRQTAGARLVRLLCVLFVFTAYVQGQARGTSEESNRDKSGQQSLDTSQSKNPAHPDKIDEYIKREITARNVPGLAFAVMKNGRILRQGAYGLANVETGAHVGIDSVFELASVTKPITAVSVMMLVEQKKLAFDDPVDKYLAEVPAPWHEITIRELLSHTSGLREYGLVKCDGSELLDISTRQQFEDLIKSPLLFAPGTGTQYSDAGYFILGMIIESVSGQSYRDFLQQRIFGPLGMQHTSVLDQSAIIPNRVSSYTLRKGQLKNARRSWQHELPSWYGIWSTVEDMVKFDVGLSSGALVKLETLERMWDPVTLKDGKNSSIDQNLYGLGWFILSASGHRIVGHPGWTGTLYLKYPDDDISIILLTNLDAGSGSQHVFLAQAILTLLRPELPRFLPKGE
ncbi:MAG TPA: serine hydrolase domain-containing protein [Candidatus Acidoferrum sp.]|jgi:D-alanyl-D-alanine carboxypeptidase|nr:serine hydrolase domain-containing protein [Candidatus Acidoferrum sp.]